ncbi:MAG TPA: class I SAM-dependent methyltransferase [Pyrinomonadaceae bacterium]|nr:class I SAM-dependent methyltransferase [Pyrinomonadaceae bacterium]
MIIQEQKETRKAWNKIAAGYAEFVTHGHEWLANEGFRRADLRPGMRFLDVAAGCGALSIPAARLGAQVLATDLSPVMLEQLRARAQREGLKLETQVMDGQALELENDTFDVAASQFGVMLFPDMPRGISELARVTRPGGRVLMHVFGTAGKVEFFVFFVRAVQAAVPGFNGPPMDPPPLPFQLQDPDRLYQELARAGLKHIRVDTITEELEYQSGMQLWNWLKNSNPIVETVLEQVNLTKEQTGVVQQALDDMIRDRAGESGPAVLTVPINIGVGTK